MNRFALGCLLALLAVPAAALEPYLVKDINPFPEPASSIPSGFVTLGGVAIFSAEEEPGDQELWRSDGTAAGTWQLADLCALEGCGGYPLSFAVTDRLVFFTTYEDLGNRRTLWVTDGTPAGTASLGGVAVEGTPLWVPAQGALYFSGSDGEHGFELWRSDGTPAGTYMVSDLLPGLSGSAPRSLTLFKGRIWFGGISLKGGALWRSDGTAKGTEVVKELGKRNPSVTDRNLRPFYLHVLGKRLVFAADASLGRHDLWASDGTAKGTARLTQWTRGTAHSLVFWIAVQGSRTWVVADDGRNGQELWVTDGTAKGTRMLTRFARAEAFYLDDVVDPSMLVIPNLTGGRLVFGAHDGPHGLELWSTDGTAQGTRLLKEICPGACHGLGSLWLAHRGRLYFSGNDGVHGWEPWVTDGTAAGTRLLRDICPGDCSSATGDTPVALGDRLLWSASEDDGRNAGLWITDGTEAGTDRVSDVILPFSFRLSTVLGGRLLFTARDDAHGTELWITDGTDAGTSLVRDIADADLGGSDPTSLRAFGDLAVFLADDGIHGFELWKSDGTEAGTALVADLVPGEEPVGQPVLGWTEVAGGKLFFVKSDRLWRTDGTEAGTLALTGEHVSLCCSRQVRAVGDKVFFPVYDGEYRLWVSDGTAAGTRPVGDTGDGSIQDLVEFQGKLYFTLRSDFWELWRSDGTDAGTVRVEELGPLPSAGVSSGTPHLTVHAGSLWYFGSDGAGGTELRRAGTALDFHIKPSFVVSLGAKLLVSGTDGASFGLWATDGTPAGTQLLGPARSDGHAATVFQGRFYYSVYDEPAARSFLWTTDGTPAGTGPLHDREGAEVLAAYDAAPLGDLLLFTTDDRRLWQTDGTAAGTLPVRDLDRVSLELVRAGSRVFFADYDRATGAELWAIDQP